VAETVIDYFFTSLKKTQQFIDTSSSQKLWSFPTGKAVESSPTVVDGIVYFGSNDHNLYALNATSGQQKWFFQTGGRVRSSPTVINDVVYVGSEDGNLYAIFA